MQTAFKNIAGNEIFSNLMKIIKLNKKYNIKLYLEEVGDLNNGELEALKAVDPARKEMLEFMNLAEEEMSRAVSDDDFEYTPEHVKELIK